jgi:hypothetical protein
MLWGPSFVLAQFDRFEPFEEVETFLPGSLTAQLGVTLGNDLKLENRDVLSLQIPGIHLLLDKSIGKNIGLGLRVGAKGWRADKIAYNYRYFSAAVRGTYHINLFERLDPYLGMAVTGRRFSIGNGEELVSDIRVGVGIVAGARYLFTERLGGFLEFAGDGIGGVHTGIALKIK